MEGKSGGVTSELSCPNYPSRARHYAIGTPSRTISKQRIVYFRAPRYGGQPSLACQPKPSQEGEGLVGLTRFELVTPRLSSVCSNQLSYRPVSAVSKSRTSPVLSKLDRTCAHITCRVPDRSFKSSAFVLADFGERDSRKEVIQPQVLL